MKKTPQASKVDHIIEQHGQTRNDQYAWLRDENWQKFIYGELEFKNPEVKKYIDEENDYTNGFYEEHKPLQEKLYKEILGRIKEDDSSYPDKYKEYYYYRREEKGKNYPIYCRKKGSLEAAEEIYFDVNKEAEGLELFIVGQKEVSPCNKYFAYAFNTTGSLERTIKIRDLATGKDLDWEISDTNGSFEWSNDGQSLYYVKRDPDSGRGKTIYKMNIHKGPESSKLLYEKPAELDRMFMGLNKTTSERFLQIELSNSSSNQIHFIDLDSDSDEIFLHAPVTSEVQYSVEHFEDSFYILTSKDGATNSKLMRTPINNFSEENWEEVIPESQTHFLEGHYIYCHHLILDARNNEKALNELWVRDLKTGVQKSIQMNQAAYDLSFSGSSEFESETVRFTLESPVTPYQTIEYNLNTEEQKVLKIKEVPTFDPSQYELKRIFAPAHDGELIPLTVFHKKGLELNGENPAFVYSYGSYGFSMPAWFNQGLYSLIDRGFVATFAHIRGGSDKGHAWYLDGKLKKKKNTFLDFISCCEHLVNEKYTKAGKIAANGGSAGGLLMGAITNMRPDLFKSIVADVAFVDMINTISDESLPLTPPEWEEWGNPIKNKDDFDYMMSYSPYDNIEAKNYPNMLYNSGISDEQVTYWEPTKMVAKLRELKTDENLLLLNMKMHAGHAGASKKYEWVEDKAKTFTFVLSTFGIKE